MHCSVLDDVTLPTVQTTKVSYADRIHYIIPVTHQKLYFSGILGVKSDRVSYGYLQKHATQWALQRYVADGCQRGLIQPWTFPGASIDPTRQT